MSADLQEMIVWSPAQQVLRISELREAILFQLPAEDLIVAQQTCKAFQDIVKTSKILQERLFLRLTTTALPPSWGNTNINLLLLPETRVEGRFIDSFDALVLKTKSSAWQIVNIQHQYGTRDGTDYRYLHVKLYRQGDTEDSTVTKAQRNSREGDRLSVFDMFMCAEPIEVQATIVFDDIWGDQVTETIKMEHTPTVRQMLGEADGVVREINELLLTPMKPEPRLPLLRRESGMVYPWDTAA